jgi:hypothetical protein
MEHHSRMLGRSLHNRWLRDKVNGSGRVSWETPLIKYCMTTDYNPLFYWVPEFPCFDTFWIANKNTLL